MTFWATLVTLTNQLISADFNQLISYFPSDLGIFNQNYNMGHFSHSILVTEPDSLIRITKFQEFWIFWNLWNLSANMTYLAFLPKQDTFPTQIEVPGPILISKRRNLRESSNLEFILESLESRFQISEIFQISTF